MEDYVTRKEFKKAIKEINGKIDDIKDNHLAGIIERVNTLRWVFIAGMAVLGVVLGVLQVFG